MGAAQYGNITLLQAHRLRVVLDADDMAFRDTTAHEYNLDDIKVSHAAASATLSRPVRCWRHDPVLCLPAPCG